MNNHINRNQSLMVKRKEMDHLEIRYIIAIVIQLIVNLMDWLFKINNNSCKSNYT